LIFETAEEQIALCGTHDRNLREIREALGVKLVARDGMVRVIGEPQVVARAGSVLARLLTIVRDEERVTPSDVRNAIEDVLKVGSKTSGGPVLGKVSAKSSGQAAYMQAMLDHDIVFCIGPAGTGKTYLAVAAALVALKSKGVKRIVLARPALEAGEKLGYLPGDLQAKVNPYLRPLYDALQDILGIGQMKRYIESDLVEIVPLAYMRGRTLNDAFVILDEAQNCTVLQMKMFLTRLGMRSKSVITGDVSQIDLPPGEESGLVHSRRILEGIRGLKFVTLTQKDIVRHRLVQRIVDAYEKDQTGKSDRRSSDRGSAV